LSSQTVGGTDTSFRYFEKERLYSVQNLYSVNLRESPRRTFTTAEQRRGEAAAVYNILHSPSPARHYEIKAYVTIKNVPMWPLNNRVLITGT
jgi:hypothetical protein